ncbi:MAG: S9 family peptidase, partial [Gemmatimonadetes bacterium]|nr:S9 family peptidase [Gemmatimonadota bacterium]
MLLNRLRPIWHRCFCSLTLVIGLATAAAAQAPTLVYPTTQAGDVVDHYHGARVPDPYRWLEDTNSPQTGAWVTAQNEVTFRYLEALPARAPLQARLTRLWNYPKYGTPFREGGLYFFSKYDGLQNQSVLYVQPSLVAEPSVLLDPNTLAADGTVA